MFIKTRAGAFTNLPRCGKVVSTKVGCGRFYGKCSRVPPALVTKRGFDDGTNSATHHDDNLITRRSIFIGAAASLICAPAIVRAASLMPVRSLILPIERPSAGFVERLGYYWMDIALSRGWNAERDGRTFGGISEDQAKRSVAYARKNGLLSR